MSLVLLNRLARDMDYRVSKGTPVSRQGFGPERVCGLRLGLLEAVRLHVFS